VKCLKERKLRHQPHRPCCCPKNIRANSLGSAAPWPFGRAFGLHPLEECQHNLDFNCKDAKGELTHSCP